MQCTGSDQFQMMWGWVCTQIPWRKKQEWVSRNTWARWNRIIFNLFFFCFCCCCWLKSSKFSWWIDGWSSILVREDLRCRCILTYWKTMVEIWSRTISRFSFSHLSLFKCENNILTKRKKTMIFLRYKKKKEEEEEENFLFYISSRRLIRKNLQ